MSDKKVQEYSESLRARSQQVKIRIGSAVYPIAMVLDMDALIDDVIEIERNMPTGNPACPYGATLWPSTRAFADFAENLVTSERFDFSKVKNAIELGCGVGVGSCILAKLGVKKILATDIEPNLHFLVEENARTFGVEGHISFEALDWAKPLPAHMKRAFDFVLACDVLYEPSHIKMLPKIASQVLSVDGVFYLGDPKRYCYLSAVEELKKCFGSVVERSIRIENENIAATQGVVNTKTDFTEVQILECRNPLQH